MRSPDCTLRGMTSVSLHPQGGKLYLVFEYVERTVLEDLERHPRGLPEAEVKRIIWQLLQVGECASCPHAVFHHCLDGTYMI